MEGAVLIVILFVAGLLAYMVISEMWASTSVGHVSPPPRAYQGRSI